MKNTFLEVIELITNSMKEVWETVKQFLFKELAIKAFGEEFNILFIIEKIKELFEK